MGRGAPFLPTSQTHTHPQGSELTLAHALENNQTLGDQDVAALPAVLWQGNLNTLTLHSELRVLPWSIQLHEDRQRWAWCHGAK